MKNTYSVKVFLEKPRLIWKVVLNPMYFTLFLEDSFNMFQTEFDENSFPGGIPDTLFHNS